MSVKQLRDNVEADRLREEHNRDLIKRMRNGEPLTSFNSESSWFPPRPIIEKDEGAISKLYGDKAEKKEEHAKEKGRILQLAK